METCFQIKDNDTHTYAQPAIVECKILTNNTLEKQGQCDAHMNIKYSLL